MAQRFAATRAAPLQRGCASWSCGGNQRAIPRVSRGDLAALKQGRRENHSAGPAVVGGAAPRPTQGRNARP
eukprot:2172871-Pyramimonas_sp.AAC.1